VPIIEGSDTVPRKQLNVSCSRCDRGTRSSKLTFLGRPLLRTRILKRNSLTGGDIGRRVRPQFSANKNARQMGLSQNCAVRREDYSSSRLTSITATSQWSLSSLDLFSALDKQTPGKKTRSLNMLTSGSRSSLGPALAHRHDSVEAAERVSTLQFERRGMGALLRRFYRPASRGRTYTMKFTIPASVGDGGRFGGLCSQGSHGRPAVNTACEGGGAASVWCPPRINGADEVESRDNQRRGAAGGRGGGSLRGRFQGQTGSRKELTPAGIGTNYPSTTTMCREITASTEHFDDHYGAMTPILRFRKICRRPAPIVQVKECSTPSLRV